MAAMRKLRAKGATGLDKEDPNAVKRKRSSDGDISARVEKSLTSPKGTRRRAVYIYVYICIYISAVKNNALTQLIKLQV